MALRRLYHQVRRTLLAFVPALARPEDAFAKRCLSPAEYGLYLGMDRRDRHHACAVARTVLRQTPAASAELVRAAFLHDVGKSLLPYSAFARILVHLYTPRAIPPTPVLAGWRRAWQVHRHHGHYGATMILESGGGPRVAEIVSRHHAPEGDAEARLLKRIDEGF